MSKQKKDVAPWTQMLAENGARQRIERESPDAIKILDYLQSKVKVFEEVGWTAFNDWLDQCYRKKYMERRPTGIPYISLDGIRCIVFPSAR